LGELQLPPPEEIFSSGGGEIPPEERDKERFYKIIKI